MNKVFEDYFMDIQERIVATCIEALEDIDKQVEMTYIYAFSSDSQIFFNVFFRDKKQILSYEDLGVSDNIIDQVFDLGMDDIESITLLFKNNHRKSPNQYKLVYNNVDDQYDANYDYDDLETSKLGPMDKFLEWKSEIHNKFFG